jgi:hypothetical protein
MQIVSNLNSKFGDNLKSFLADNPSTCQELDLRARAIAAIGQVASENSALQPSQIEIVQIFDEVFSDIILSIYFTACALDKPAQSNLRRALELGTAIIYLWDLPHAFWAWKVHDSDLNFNDMLDHLSKEGYKTFLTSLNSKYPDDVPFDYHAVKRLYRALSNTIHGKISTHVSNLPDRFSYRSADCQYNLELIASVQEVLLRLFKRRFPDYFACMVSRIPAVSQLI